MKRKKKDTQDAIEVIIAAISAILFGWAMLLMLGVV